MQSVGPSPLPTTLGNKNVKTEADRQRKILHCLQNVSVLLLMGQKREQYLCESGLM